MTMSKASHSCGHILRGVAARPLENGAEVNAVDHFCLVKRGAAFDPDCSPKHDRTIDPPTSIWKLGDRLASLVGIQTRSSACVGAS